MPTPRSTRRLRASFGLVLVLAGALSLTACSPASSPGGDADHTVTIVGTSFGEDFTIPVGGTVVFVNSAGRNHTVTNGVDGEPNEDPLFDIELADGETSDPITFAEAGTYHVTCRIHPSMHLTITVE